MTECAKPNCANEAAEELFISNDWHPFCAPCVARAEEISTENAMHIKGGPVLVYQLQRRPLGA